MKYFLIIIILLFVSKLFAQEYQMVIYDLENKQLDTIPSIVIDTSKIFDNTSWNYGNNDVKEILSLLPPDSTYNNSGFTDFLPAQNFFSVDKYPIRTAVKLFRMENDTLKQTCSGTLIAKNYVLTDCHCIGKYDSTRALIFRDTMYVSPAYDNGKENSLFGKSKVLEYVTFAINLKPFYKKDIALLKIEDNLGTNTGWMGIAFNEDNTFFENNVFHKFSYPMTLDFFDTTRVYNGDTLYYNYGKLGLIQKKEIGYDIFAIIGQSGSSLFYTDNEEYYSFGTLVWAGNSRHIRINREIFYSFQSIINDNIADVKQNVIPLEEYYLSDAYPNPFNPSANIIYSLPTNSKVKIQVFNLLGEHITELVNEEQQKGTYSIRFDGSNLSSGMYFYLMESNNFRKIKKVLLVK